MGLLKCIFLLAFLFMLSTGKTIIYKRLEKNTLNVCEYFDRRSFHIFVSFDKIRECLFLQNIQHSSARRN